MKINSSIRPFAVIMMSIVSAFLCSSTNQSDLWYSMLNCANSPAEITQLIEYVESTGKDTAEGQLLMAQLYGILGSSVNEKYFSKADSCLTQFKNMGGSASIYQEESVNLIELRQVREREKDIRQNNANNAKNYGNYHWANSYKDMDMVDLGLSVAWATFNVGASTPEGNGDLFAWAETSPKKKYTEKNSMVCHDINRDPATYIECYSRSISNSAFHDPCPINTRIPTKSEMQELIDNCFWEKDTINNVPGWRVTGSTGNSIFLPIPILHKSNWTQSICMGYGGINNEGGYWTADMRLELAEYGHPQAYCLNLSWKPELTTWYVSEGYVIRPVGDITYLTE